MSIASTVHRRIGFWVECSATVPPLAFDVVGRTFDHRILCTGICVDSVPPPVGTRWHAKMDLLLAPTWPGLEALSFLTSEEIRRLYHAADRGAVPAQVLRRLDSPRRWKRAAQWAARPRPRRPRSGDLDALGCD